MPESHDWTAHLHLSITSSCVGPLGWRVTARLPHTAVPKIQPLSSGVSRERWNPFDPRPGRDHAGDSTAVVGSSPLLVAPSPPLVAIAYVPPTSPRPKLLIRLKPADPSTPFVDGPETGHYSFASPCVPFRVAFNSH